MYMYKLLQFRTLPSSSWHCVMSSPTRPPTDAVTMFLSRYSYMSYICVIISKVLTETLWSFEGVQVRKTCCCSEWICRYVDETMGIFNGVSLFLLMFVIWWSFSWCMAGARIVERKLRRTKVRLFTLPCCSIILFSSEGMKKNLS